MQLLFYYWSNIFKKSFEVKINRIKTSIYKLIYNYNMLLTSKMYNKNSECKQNTLRGGTRPAGFTFIIFLTSSVQKGWTE